MSSDRADDPSTPRQTVQYNARAPRFPSHALVEIKMNRWNPFAKHSAALLDMSVSGYKLQFVERVSLMQGAKFTLIIPLEPFGILGGGKLSVQTEAKWFDPEMLRLGGIFINCSDHERLMIERIIASVISRSTD